MTIVSHMEVLGGVAKCPPRRPASPLAQRLRAQALELAAAEGLGQASFAFRIQPLKQPPGQALQVGDEWLEAPWLIPASGALTDLACGVCTLGSELEERVRSLFSNGRRALALALDSLGNEMLFEASRRMHHRMLAETSRRGLSLSGELRSGDPGLALDTQAAVLRLADAGAVSVTASEGAVMHPLKSTSAIFGVGIDLPAARWSRCDNCKFTAKCGIARQAAVVA